MSGLKEVRRSPDGFRVSHVLRTSCFRVAVLISTVALLVPVAAVAASAATVGTEMVTTPAPWISRTFPTIGSATGGDRVTITGHHFTGVSSVRFGGVPATNLVVESDTRIVVTTPAHAVGQARVRMVAPGRSSVRGVTYEFVDPPTVTGVSPSSGPIAGGTTVTVTGVHLDETCCVRFGGVVATDYQVVNDTTLTVTVPPHVAGDARVRVIAPDTSSPRSSAARFTYIAGPHITSKSPPDGPTTGGTSVTIAGTGFTGTTSVTFDGIAASYVVNSDTSITAVSPPHAAGFVSVVVTTPYGTWTDPSYAYPFIYDP